MKRRSTEINIKDQLKLMLNFATLRFSDFNSYEMIYLNFLFNISMTLFYLFIYLCLSLFCLSIC